MSSLTIVCIISKKKKKKREHLLQEARLMFRLVMVAKLNLTLVASKLAGFVKGDWMRSIQNVVPGLATNTTKTHQPR